MKKFYVISHTHWDREWYMPFEQFRMRLVDLIDRLMEIVRANRSYRFHLDAQTIVLEDYLEIRPHKREELKEMISAGNIIVGPWYLQNDFYLTSGEATIRNLMIGRKIAAKIGGGDNIGYAPDQFGNIGQLPQILNNFGIDTFLFGRGYTFYLDEACIRPVPMPPEFYWYAPDGSRCLAVVMPFWYNNAQRFSADPEKSLILLEENEKGFDDCGGCPLYLLMNGVDHLQPQEDLLAILDNLQARRQDIEIGQRTLAEYFDDLKLFIKKAQKKLPEHRKALNFGNDNRLLKGCWSTKSYLKTLNVRAQTKLENILEPLYAMLYAAGVNVYDGDKFMYFWKKLLRFHPHDSICGCSRDEVHAHMEDDFRRFDEAADDFLERGMLIAAEHMAEGSYGKNCYALTYVNTTERGADETCEAELYFPRTEGVNGFMIYDETGVVVEYELLKKYPSVKDVFSPVNLPGEIDTDNFQILLPVSVPAMSFKRYFIVPGKVRHKKFCRARAAENKFYRLEFINGTVFLTDKKSGRRYEDFIGFVSDTDTGDTYQYMPPENGVRTKAELLGCRLSGSVFRPVMALTYRLRVPKKYDFEAGRPSVRMVDIHCSVSLTLTETTERIGISYRVDNRACDHRVRLYVRAAEKNSGFCADVPFDVVDCSVFESCPVTSNKSFCNSTIVAEKCEGGITLFTEGLHEVEKEGDVFYLTVVRATGLIYRPQAGAAAVGKQWFVPENQELRSLTGRLGVFIGSGDAVKDGIFVRAKQFRVGLPCVFTSLDEKKYSGGRFAVQGAKWAELYYPEKLFPKASVDSCKPALCIGDDRIALSAYKKAEDGDSQVVRIWNMSGESLSVPISVSGTIYQSDMTEREGACLGKNQAIVRMRPKEIKTILIKKL